MNKLSNYWAKIESELSDKEKKIVYITLSGVILLLVYGLILCFWGFGFDGWITYVLLCFPLLIPVGFIVLDNIKPEDLICKYISFSIMFFGFFILAHFMGEMGEKNKIFKLTENKTYELTVGQALNLFDSVLVLILFFVINYFISFLRKERKKWTCDNLNRFLSLLIFIEVAFFISSLVHCKMEGYDKFGLGLFFNFFVFAFLPSLIFSLLDFLFRWNE